MPCSSGETNVGKLYEAESNEQGARRDAYEQLALDLVTVARLFYAQCLNYSLKKKYKSKNKYLLDKLPNHKQADLRSP